MTEFHAIQLNVAGSNARMHALLNDPLFLNFSLFIIQDPWWGRIGSQKDTNSKNHTIYGTVASPNYQLIIPLGFDDPVGPGVAIYFRLDSGLHVRFSDFSPIHRDILTVDIHIDNSVSTIVNVYPHGETHDDTIMAITNINTITNRPVILTGDFNLHHPEWALDNSHWAKKTPSNTTKHFQNYAECNDLYLMNHTSLPTRIAPNNPKSNSIIDLTFLNSAAVDAWPDFNWEVEPSDSTRSLGSDHMAISWTIGPHDQDESTGVTEPSPGYIIDPSLEDDWASSYTSTLAGSNIPTNPQTAEDADAISGSILAAMSSASDRIFHKKTGTGPACTPWWNGECSKAVRNLKHNPDHKTPSQLRATLRGAIHRARKNCGLKILDEIKTRKVFNCTKWFQGKRRALCPPIKSPTGGPTATHPYQKGENFAKQFFPSGSSPNISFEPLGIKPQIKRPFQPITTEEIASSLALTSNKSAPGAFGSNYLLLKWVFYSNPDTFTKLFNVCLNTGYHPVALRNAVISPIPKPRRTDMSLPKNYRPIVLLETLSKLLEKVITKRLIHEAGANNLIPHAQFGGRDISSCTDAGLCMIHDIRAAWSCKKAASLLTLDVSGYFNNMDHNQLIYTLDWLGYSDQICNWLRLYLSNRSAQFRIDGILCPHIQLPLVGVPQGSPLSPVLSSLYSIPLLIASTDPQAHSFAYIDDFTILAYSNTHQENIDIIKDITSRISNVATKLGLEFELPKSELIHFIRRGSPHSNPSLTISELGTDTVINPQECVRWLGFWLDRKLSFKQHVTNMATKAKAMIAGLCMLSNTIRGLSTRHARILYKACVTPILCYGAPLWFYEHRHKSLLKPLSMVQNQGLRWLLGAFRTTPVPVMEHLASIPPLHITCQKLMDNMAAKTKSIPRLAEIARRTPASWDHSDPSLPKPRISPIVEIAKLSHPDIEPIIPYLSHPSAPANPFGDNLVIRTQEGIKKDEVIRAHLDHIRTNSRSPTPALVGYSDGHAQITAGQSKIAYGFVLLLKDNHAIEESVNIGPRASIYDAEMLGIAECLKRAVETAKDHPQYTHIEIYCDNRAAVQSIVSTGRHPAQYASLKLRHALRNFLSGHPERHVTIAWVPGHTGIPGNDRADTLAKRGADMPSRPTFNRTVTWARTNATQRATETWNKEWAKHCESRPNSDTFIPRPPSHKLHPIFNKLWMPRNVAARLVQLISGHGLYGDYIHRFNLPLDDKCGCGESQYSTAHAIALCSQQEEHRHILRKHSPGLKFNELFGSLAGLKAVARFLAGSGLGKRPG